MNLETIADAYSANDEIRTRLIETVGKLSEAEGAIRTENGKWTVQGIVEHLAKVEAGMTGISTRLLQKAEGEEAASDSTLSLSESFLESASNWSNDKFVAPEIVEPTGAQTIAESLSKMESSRGKLDQLRPLFESFFSASATFPHPYFGQLTAHDWLVLIGAHEARHIDQIDRILSSQK